MSTTTTAKALSLRKAAEQAAESLESAADLCELWAAESRNNGWSTHQVDANLRLAAIARRDAGTLRRALRESGEL